MYTNTLIKSLPTKKYLDMFSDSYEFFEADNYFFAVAPNPLDDFRQFSYVNGLNIINAGSHIEYITNEVVQRIKASISRKYPNIKNGDIKNKLFVVAVLREVPDLKFDSQTKQKVTNSTAEIKAYFGDINFDALHKKIMKNTSIIDPITEVYRIKEEFKRRQELKGLDKTVKKIKSDKYIPATHVKKYLILCEGASARGGLMPVLGRKEFGYYELKGVPLNAYDSPQSKFTSNEELSELYKILRAEGYQYIIQGTDQDLDGFHIRGLLLGFFHRYAPEYLETGRLGVLNTPILGAKKNGKLVKWWYKLGDYDESLCKGLEVKWYKGLGSHKEKDLKEIIAKDGIERMIEIFEMDDASILSDWLLGKNADIRKEYIKENEFNLVKI